jgi:hypothetical protein
MAEIQASQPSRGAAVFGKKGINTRTQSIDDKLNLTKRETTGKEKERQRPHEKRLGDHWRESSEMAC